MKGHAGYNVIGYVSGALGIGVTARNICQLVLDRGYPLRIADLDPTMGRYRADLTYDRFCVPSPLALSGDVNLVVLPPETIASNMGFIEQFLDVPGRLTAAFSMWELPVMPPVWCDALERMDAVVAESEFIRHTFAIHLSGVHTIGCQHPLWLPPDIGPCRDHFGLPEGKVLFVTSFDPMSDPMRKNPLAAVEAFRRAFPDDDRVGLVLKVNDTRSGLPAHPIQQRLEEEAAADPRITILARKMGYAEVLGLYASCDVFVSMHRAEGLGLGLMEAMALGRPVIATGWSGNLSFMDHTNSCLVGYRLVKAAGSTQVYNQSVEDQGAFWADPSVDDAAFFMRRLADDPGYRVRIGQRAARDMDEYRRRADQGRFLDELDELLESRRFCRAARWTRPEVPRALGREILRLEEEARVRPSADGYMRLARACKQAGAVDEAAAALRTAERLGK